MKRFAACALLAALPALCADRVVPIALYYQFQQKPPDAVLETIHDELRGILSPIGLNPEWRSLGENQGNEISAQLAIIHFKGRCDTADLRPFSVNPGPLGWTHISEGVILPFADIDCDGIRGFVQRDLLTWPQPEREEAYARAVARVLAHELYHIFANTRHHAGYGIAKAAYSVQELLARSFEFDKRDCDALRTYRVRLELQASMTGD